MCHETDPRFGHFCFSADKAAAPTDLQALLDDCESLPFRRREYERQAMLEEIIGAFAV